MSTAAKKQTLTVVEAGKLALLEKVIDQGFKTFIEVGQAFKEIRDSRLYRATHPTFEAYCREKWGTGRIAVNQRIRDSNMALEIEEAIGISLPSGNAAASIEAVMAKAGREKALEVVAKANATGKITANNILDTAEALGIEGVSGRNGSPERKQRKKQEAQAAAAVTPPADTNVQPWLLTQMYVARRQATEQPFDLDEVKYLVKGLINLLPEGYTFGLAKE